MKVFICAITVASAGAAVLAGCGTGAGAHPPGDLDAHHFTPIATVGPPAPLAVAGNITSSPDAEGNPPCPVSDSWGKSPIDKGIFVTYWDYQTDYVTALVRTSLGTDFAKSVNVDPDHQPMIFDFPNVDAATVRQVLITTNAKRCYATPDPATSGR
jgi:hypothetical protein